MEGTDEERKAMRTRDCRKREERGMNRGRELSSKRRGTPQAVYLLQAVHPLPTVSVNVVEYLHNHFLQGLVCVGEGVGRERRREVKSS